MLGFKSGGLVALVVAMIAQSATASSILVLDSSPNSGTPVPSVSQSGLVLSISNGVGFGLAGKNGVQAFLPGVPGATGTVSIVLTGFSPAIAFEPIPGSYTEFFGGGLVQIFSSTSTLLLSGSAASAELNLNTAGSGTGSFLSIGDVTFGPSDPIYKNAFVPAGYVNPGTFDFALSPITGAPVFIGPVGGAGVLLSFSADITDGTYNATPAPSSTPTPAPATVWSGMGLIGVLGAMAMMKKAKA